MADHYRKDVVHHPQYWTSLQLPQNPDTEMSTAPTENHLALSINRMVHIC